MPRDTQAVSPESGLSHRVGAVERGSLPALQTQMPLGQEGALVAVRVCPLACCAVLGTHGYTSRFHEAGQ